MISKFSKHISVLLSLLMIITAIVPMFVIPASAAEIETYATNTDLDALNVNGLSAAVTQAATSDGNGTWTATGTNSIKASLVGKYSTSKILFTTYHIYAASSTVLTFTNNLSSEAVLQFDYTVTIDNGSVKIGSTTLSGSNSYEGKIAAGGTLDLTLSVTRKSKNSNSPNDASITITGLRLFVDSANIVTFKPATEGGSYTVGEDVIDSTTEMQVGAVDKITMTATPASGYSFAGWHSEEKGYLSADVTYVTNFTESQTVTAKFIPTTDAIFGVGDARFDDLTIASICATGSTNKIVVLLKDATLEGNHTVAAGSTLLIPYEATNKCPTTDPVSTTGNISTKVAYRTLTLASGATITVEGAVSVAAEHVGTQGSNIYGGAVKSTYGCIQLNDGSNLTIAKSATLYAWGYIIGEGTVTALNGATVYEKMQITDYRGGTNTLTIAGRGEGVFPFNQYYVQNIESAITLHHGALLKAHAALVISGDTIFASSIDFIGGDTAMFQIAEDSSITKRYDGTTDRLIFDTLGNISMKNLVLNVNGVPLIGSMVVDSAEYVLPINGNVTINIGTGMTTIKQDILLQPGTQVNVASDAILVLGDPDTGDPYNCYVMDSENWGNFAFSNKTHEPVPFAPSRTGNPRKTAPLTDAVVNINGMLMNMGNIYTSTAGASVISSESTGRIIMTADAPAATTVGQYTGDATLNNINVNPAWLKNGNTETPFTLTEGSVAMDMFLYDSLRDMWMKPADDLVLNFDANGGIGAPDPITVTLVGLMDMS